MQIITQLFGYLGLAMAVISFQVNDKKKILIFQMLCGFSFTIHFILLGAYTGAVLNFLSSARNIVFYNKNKKWASSLFWPSLFAVLFIITGIATWEGIVTLFPVLACLVFTVSMYIDNTRLVRRISWISSPCWMVYNIIKGSYGGVLTETFNLISIFIAIYRYDIRGKQKEAERA